MTSKQRLYLPTGNGKVQTKKDFIIKYYQNNPDLRTQDIKWLAITLKTSANYVYKVLSDHRRKVRSERHRRMRSAVSAHGLMPYECEIPASWVAELDVEAVNRVTGMKQLGFKDRGDPCSAQFHKNGKVVVFDHRVNWQDWLLKELVSHGWHEDQAYALTANLNVRVYRIEVAKAKSGKHYLPKGFEAKFDWGVILCRDDTPDKGTLEIKLLVPDMSRYLGLPEIKKDVQLVIKELMKQRAERRGSEKEFSHKLDRVEEAFDRFVSVLESQKFENHNRAKRKFGEYVS